MKRKLVALLIAGLIEWRWLVYANPSILESTDTNNSPAYMWWAVFHGPIVELLPVDEEWGFVLSAGFYAVIWAAVLYGIFLQPLGKSADRKGVRRPLNMRGAEM